MRHVAIKNLFIFMEITTLYFCKKEIQIKAGVIILYKGGLKSIEIYN